METTPDDTEARHDCVPQAKSQPTEVLVSALVGREAGTTTTQSSGSGLAFVMLTTNGCPATMHPFDIRILVVVAEVRGNSNKRSAVKTVANFIANAASLYVFYEIVRTRLGTAGNRQQQRIK
jgi:hypothetical protein